MKYTDTYQYSILEKLSYPRFGGTDGELRAAKLLQNEITALGGQSELMPFDIPAYEIERCAMTANGKNIPCVAVSTIEELCENLSPLTGILVPCMDARRNQVYNALFRSEGGRVTRLTPDRAISIEELAAELKSYEGEDVYLSGDGYEVAYKGLVSYDVTPKETPPLLILENAASVAKIALRKYNSGEYTDDISLSPTYLRLPQAERERLERESAK